MAPGNSEKATYWDYLRLDRLLSIQGGLEGDEATLLPDELHFIVVHQAFELWFKLVLRELRLGRDHLAAPRLPEESVPYVVHHLGRVGEILRLMVEQFRVMETLTPQDFLAFRDKLGSASGFQSFQMRELEILLGLADADRIGYGAGDPLEQLRRAAAGSPGGAHAWERIEAARREKSFKDALRDWLHRTPIRGSGPDAPDDDAVVESFLRDYLSCVERHNGEQAARSAAAGAGTAAELEARFADGTRAAREFLLAADAPEAERRRTRRIRAGLLFIESYRDLPLLAWPRLLVDTVVDLEEQMALWRNRHARMVERTIGRRIGTGGSSGVDYLDRTAGYRVFGELWAVRTLLLPTAELPPLERPEIYGFGFGG